MNVEDSYEGAVRRLRRLELAAIEGAPPRSAIADAATERMRELEELATLACEENERLTGELESARDEAQRLRGQVAMLQQTLTSAVAEEEFPYPPKSRGKGAAFYFFVIAIIGTGAAALAVLRPWDRPHAAPVVVDPVVTAAPAIAPVAVTPPPAPAVPKIEPAIPKVAPAIPKVAPIATAPRVQPAAASAKAHRHGKHHAVTTRRHESRHERKKSGSGAHAKQSGVSDTDDPLGGVNL
jgi:hypothetical protein